MVAICPAELLAATCPAELLAGWQRVGGRVHERSSAIHHADARAGGAVRHLLRTSALQRAQRKLLRRPPDGGRRNHRAHCGCSFGQASQVEIEIAGEHCAQGRSC